MWAVSKFVLVLVCKYVVEHVIELPLYSILPAYHIIHLVIFLIMWEDITSFFLLAKVKIAGAPHLILYVWFSFLFIYIFLKLVLNERLHLKKPH